MGKRIRARKSFVGRTPAGRIFGVSLLLLLLLLLLPIVFLSGLEREPIAKPEPPEPAPPVEERDAPLPPTPAKSDGLPVREGLYSDDTAAVRVLMPDGSLFETPMYDYLWHVVAAEMPAAFEPDALRAQTVAVRTYALRKMIHGEQKHPGFDVCTDITCCQAFVKRADAAAIWGDRAEEYSGKVTAAVSDTCGLVVTYEGEIIDAVFHSSSAGRTADAVEVWGSPVPYLTSVDSPESELDVPNYHSTSTVLAAEFQALMSTLHPGAKLEGAPSEWFGSVTRTAAGAVQTIEVGGVTLTGAQLRAMCALRSAYFTVHPGSSEIVFEVTAYGHGVGLSQYGANTLAKQGHSFTEILTWYYTGTEVVPIA